MFSFTHRSRWIFRHPPPVRTVAAEQIQPVGTPSPSPSCIASTSPKHLQRRQGFRVRPTRASLPTPTSNRQDHRHHPDFVFQCPGEIIAFSTVTEQTDGHRLPWGFPFACSKRFNIEWFAVLFWFSFFLKVKRSLSKYVRFLSFKIGVIT